MGQNTHNRSIEKALNTDYEEPRVGLTLRQEEIVEQFKTQTYEEVADDLGISENTAQAHVQNARNLVSEYPGILGTMNDDLVKLQDRDTFLALAEVMEHYSADFEGVNVVVKLTEK